MARDYEQANAAQRWLRRFAASGPGSWLFSRMLAPLDRWTFRALEVEDERRARIWDEALRTYPGFAAYARRCAPRRISVFVIEPRAG